MTTKAALLRKIREFCVFCVCGDMDAIRDCLEPQCSLYPFRMGTDPTPSRQKAAANLSHAGKKTA